MRHITTAGISRIENTLNKGVRAEVRERGIGNRAKADNLKRERRGMMTLAGQLGALCGCLYEREEGMKRHCVCARSRSRMMTRLKHLPGPRSG